MPRTKEAQQELRQLARAYRVSKTAQFTRAFEAEPRLRWLAAAIRCCGIDDAKHLIHIVEAQHQEWLRYADTDTRALALEIVARHIRQIREKAGLMPFDDPLPEEADDVFQTVKRILG